MLAAMGSIVRVEWVSSLTFLSKFPTHAASLEYPLLRLR